MRQRSVFPALLPLLLAVLTTPALASERDSLPGLNIQRSTSTPTGNPLRAIQPLLLAGRYPEARQQLQASPTADRNDPFHWLTLAAIAAHLDEDDVAQAHLRFAYNAHPGEPQVNAAHAQHHLPQAQARPHLLNSQAAHPHAAAVHFALGNLHAQRAAWLAARAAYRDALALDPEQPDYLFNLAVSQEHCGQPDLAAKNYQRALEARRRHPAVFHPAQAEARLSPKPAPQ